MANVAGREIHLGPHLGAARGDRHDGALAFQQADRAFFGIAEGDTRAGDHVDPGLKGRGDAEIVDRQADYQHIGGLHLGHEAVGQGERCLLGVVALIGGGEVRGDPIAVDLRQAGGKIAGGDGCICFRGKFGDDPVGQVAADGPAVTGRGVDTKNGGHGGLL